MQDLLTIYEYTRYIIANFVLVIVLFIFGLILGRLVGKFTSKVLHELELDSILKKTTKRSFKLELIISKILSWAIYILFTVLSLDQLGITSPLLTWIAIVFAFLIVVSILFALKDHIPNFIAGIFIQKNNLFKVGDVINVDGMTGKVISIGLFEVELEKETDRMFIPNSVISKKKLSVNL